MRNNFLLSFLLFATLVVCAQEKNNSPYSRFGYGDVKMAGYGYNTGMAGVGASNGNLFFINGVNPALLQRNKYTVYELGLHGYSRTISSNSGSQKSTDMNLDYLAFSLPLKKANIGFGIKKISDVSYNISSINQINANDFSKIQYKGKGGLNQVNITGAYRLLEDTSSNTIMSLGLEGSYIVGQIQNNTTTELFTNGITEGERFTKINQRAYSGFRFTPGLVFRKELLYANERINTKTLAGTDSVITSRKYFHKDITEQVAQIAIIGKYAIIYPNRSGVLLDKKIRKGEDIDRLAPLYENLAGKNYGVYVLETAINASNKEIKNEFIALTVDKVTPETAPDGLLDYTNRLIRRHSGYYLNAGFAYELDATLNGTQDTYLNRDFVSGFAISKDTLTTGQSVGMTLPSTLRFGVSLDKQPAQSELSRVWTIAADIAYTKWSEFSNSESSLPYNNTYRIALGGEITPHVASSSYYKRITYRAGLSYSAVPYEVSGTSFSDFGINFGFSFPVGVFTLSTPPRHVNLGITLGQRGTLENNLVKEKYALVSLSFNFNSRWFQRYKLGL